MRTGNHLHRVSRASVFQVKWAPIRRVRRECVGVVGFQYLPSIFYSWSSRFKDRDHRSSKTAFMSTTSVLSPEFHDLISTLFHTSCLELSVRLVKPIDKAASSGTTRNCHNNIGHGGG